MFDQPIAWLNVLNVKGTGHRGEMNPKEDFGFFTGLFV